MKQTDRSHDAFIGDVFTPSPRPYETEFKEWVTDSLRRIEVMIDPCKAREDFDAATVLAVGTEVRTSIAQRVSRLTDPSFFSPSWLTEPVVGLSAGIAAERAFDRLPILADALEEAGCDNRLMLDHLRAGDDHAHHCWVVDVLRVGGGATL